MRLKALITFICCLVAGRSFAQHTVKVYYDSSRQLYSIEHWNKKNSKAGFIYYYEDGKVCAEGYEKWDKRHVRKQPDSTFIAYDTLGNIVQRMSMNKDSGVVLSYNANGTPASKIFFDRSFFYEELYFDAGGIMSRTECTLPAGLSFFTGYHTPDAWEKKNYASSKHAEPILPINFGMPAYPGFRIYSFPEVVFPHHVSVTNSKLYFPDGRLMREILNTATRNQVNNEYNEDGSRYTGPLRSYNANGTIKVW